MNTPDPTPAHPAEHPAEQHAPVADRSKTGDHGRRPTRTAGPGRVDLTKHQHPAADPGPVVVEGELVPRDAGPLTPAATAGGGRSGLAVVLRRAGTVAARQTVHVITTARTVVTHPRTTATARGVVRHVWFPIAGAGVVWTRWRDAHGASRYERMMRAAEIAGDREALLEWEARDTAEKAARHGRVMDWVRSRST